MWLFTETLADCVRWFSQRTFRKTSFALCAAVWLGSGARGFAQSDNFDGGNDPQWTRYNPMALLGAPGTFSFPSDGMGGKAYRLQAPAPPVPDAGPARLLSYRTNLYADFVATVDLLGWDDELQQTFGLVFRAQNIGLGTTTGYIFNYNAQQAAGGRGQLQINRVAGEAGAGTLAAADITFDPARRYRFVLSVAGTNFTGRVYDLADLTAPLASFVATDSDYASGAIGLFNYYRGSATTDRAAGRADTTFDNFFAAASVAPDLLARAPEIISGKPQLAGRTPASRANFYPASQGITFAATTGGTNALKTNAIRLVLNGADVSSQLRIGGTSSDADVSFAALSPNTVYEAQIVLEDVLGRKMTNEWTFDTFSEDFLDSPAVKVIEAEDYNYEGGKFQDNPPVSGVTSAGTQVNGRGTGYFDGVGVPDIDYFDQSSQIGGGLTPEYRSGDFVGTQAGSVESGSSVLENVPQNDTIRRKYATKNLPEYQVRRTEGGEWMNYTRPFAPGGYQVYLRAAARAPQPVLLQRVTSDPTRPDQSTALLGTFDVPNTGLVVNYRYIPLRDGSGKLATVNLAGLETLRLTLGGPQTNRTQHTMTINYLLFVPAGAPPPAFELESAANIAGPWQVESAAVAGPNLSFAVGLRGQTRFYRVRSQSSGARTRMTGIRIVGGNVLLQFAPSPL